MGAQHFLRLKAFGCETLKLKCSDPGSHLWNDIDIKRALYFLPPIASHDTFCHTNEPLHQAPQGLRRLPWLSEAEN
jgi:hypothetical protein